MPITEEKELLRAQAKRHRDFIDPLQDNPEDAVPHFLTHIALGKGQCIGAYWPIGREFDVRPVMDEGMKAGCVCALPAIEKDSRVLRYCLWKDGDPLIKGEFSALEPVSKTPVEPDILIVPLLAFDRHGYRLGYGGGYYDATIKALRSKKDITVVGMGYAQQAVLFNLPVEDHDQRMDWIITPHGATRYSKGV